MQGSPNPARAGLAQFSEIVRARSAMTHYTALRMLRSAADAEDAVQEAFISACRAFPKNQGPVEGAYRAPLNRCRRISDEDS